MVTWHILRALRREIMAANGSSLRELYRNLETPGTNRLRAARAALRTAYGMSPSEDPVTSFSASTSNSPRRKRTLKPSRHQACPPAA